ncbi:MAG TPA: NUDIX domain-containing protein [Nitrospiraceae bacterium]
MAKKLSAGILLYRIIAGQIQVFLVHPGGPFWARKDDGSWSLPKGEHTAEEDPLTVAKREFREETGFSVSGAFTALSTVKQPNGKVISVWAVEGDLEASSVRSNSFTVEWPPRSGRMQEFPEVDRASWFDLPTAERKLLPGQRPFLDQLREVLRGRLSAD